MADTKSTNNHVSLQPSNEVFSACVAFLVRKKIPVTDPKNPISIAQSILIYLGAGTQYAINGTNHAHTIITTFFNSRVTASSKVRAGSMGEKKQRRKDKAEKRNGGKQKGTSFYGTIEWRRVRYEALKRSSGRCECCGRSPKEGAILNVDHIKPLRKFPELSLDLNNLQVLCSICNHGKGSWDRTDWRHTSDRERDELDREYERIMGPIVE